MRKPTKRFLIIPRHPKRVCINQIGTFVYIFHFMCICVFLFVGLQFWHWCACICNGSNVVVLFYVSVSTWIGCSLIYFSSSQCARIHSNPYNSIFLTVHIHLSADTCDIASRNHTFHIICSMFNSQFCLFYSNLLIVLGQMLELIFFKRSLLFVFSISSVILLLPSISSLLISFSHSVVCSHILCARSICSFCLFSHHNGCETNDFIYVTTQLKCRVEILIIVWLKLALILYAMLWTTNFEQWWRNESHWI